MTIPLYRCVYLFVLYAQMMPLSLDVFIYLYMLKLTIPFFRCVYLFVLYTQMNDNPFI